MRTDEESILREAYDAWAASYDEMDNPLIAHAGVALAAHAGAFAGARVIELGCGTGRNAAYAFAVGAMDYTGVDGSPGMLEVARRRVQRGSWVLGDLVDGTRRAGGGFDVALVCLVLEHVKEVAPVLAAARGALREGGLMVVLELHPALHERGVGANFRATPDAEEVRLPSYRHDAEELGAALVGVGFEVVRVVEHAPSEAALARSAKLGRYAGQPVLLEIVAR